jgi:hypothetical protein
MPTLMNRAVRPHLRQGVGERAEMTQGAPPEERRPESF